MGNAMRGVTRSPRVFFSAALLALLCFAGMAAAEGTFSVPALPGVRFAEEDVANVPPGELKGQALRPDGEPHAEIEVSLLDPETGDEIATVLTDENGYYTFTDVPEGRFILRAGEPGVFSIISVTPDAAPGLLVFVVPVPAVAPLAPFAPAAALAATAEWAVSPVGLAVISSALVLTGYAIYNQRRSTRGGIVSPIFPENSRPWY